MKSELNPVVQQIGTVENVVQPDSLYFLDDILFALSSTRGLLYTRLECPEFIPFVAFRNLNLKPERVYTDKVSKTLFVTCVKRESSVELIACRVGREAFSAIKEGKEPEIELLFENDYFSGRSFIEINEETRVIITRNHGGRVKVYSFDSVKPLLNFNESDVYDVRNAREHLVKIKWNEDNAVFKLIYIEYNTRTTDYTYSVEVEPDLAVNVFELFETNLLIQQEDRDLCWIDLSAGTKRVVDFLNIDHRTKINNFVSEQLVAVSQRESLVILNYLGDPVKILHFKPDLTKFCFREGNFFVFFSEVRKSNSGYFQALKGEFTVIDLERVDEERQINTESLEKTRCRSVSTKQPVEQIYSWENGLSRDRNVLDTALLYSNHSELTDTPCLFEDRMLVYTFDIVSRSLIVLTHSSILARIFI